MKTLEQIRELKDNWLKDPCWDIEDTEGFEEHREELKLFSLEQNQRWMKEDIDRVFAYGKKIGVSLEHEALLRLLMSFERRLNNLESRAHE